MKLDKNLCNMKRKQFKRKRKMWEFKLKGFINLMQAFKLPQKINKVVQIKSLIHF